MKRLTVVALVFVVALLAGCDTDRGARKDLPNDSQNLDESLADIYLMPDKYPNVAHKCDGTTGIWVSTDRAIWVVYGDLLCGGENPVLVLDNIPGGVDGGS